MKELYLTVICSLLLLNGCVSEPIGKVNPIPDGCLSMEFFSPSDDSVCKRESGRIKAVITPIDRIEQLRKQWKLAEFEKAISKMDKNAPIANHLPGIAAWKHLKKYLQSEDEIWTFGVLD